MDVSLIPEKETIDAVSMLKRLQEEYHAKGEYCICILYIRKKLLTEKQGK